MSELRRRNVHRMAALYAIAAWLIMQVAEVIIDLANLSNWIGPTILGLLVVGFPIALIVSWFYEIAPEGISLEKDVDREKSITHVTGRRLDFIVISLLCAAVILFAYDKWWTRGPPEQSIAVLPFVNMSDDASNEYFSEGISEELLNLLTKIPELRVISRASAFSYKGKQAIASLRTTLTLSPGYIGGQYLIGTALLLKGEPESALASMQKEASEAWRLIGLVMAHHALGQAAASDAALAELIEKYKQDAANNIAYVLAFRGEADRAFEWLNKAVVYNDPGLAEIATQPLFANIQFDARWLPFRESIGMSPEQLAAIDFKVTLPE